MKTPRRMWLLHYWGGAAALPLYRRQWLITCLGAIILVIAVDAEVRARADAVRDPPQPTNDQTAADLDKIYGAKGWDIRFPSFGDTITQDYGGWRSRLASAGIGLIEYNINRFQANMLDTPRRGPTVNQFYKSAQSYWGQSPSFSNVNIMFLTYDLSRFGVPDGQLQFSGVNAYATWQGYIPDTFAMSALAYYQTFFDRRLEVKFGTNTHFMLLAGVRP
jgi:porin